MKPGTILAVQTFHFLPINFNTEMFVFINVVPYFQDNPSDFSYFFDTSRRRTCYIAPERFVDSSSRNAEAAGQNLDLTATGEVKTGDLTPAMDIFSAGYCLLMNLI